MPLQDVAMDPRKYSTCELKRNNAFCSQRKHTDKTRATLEKNFIPLHNTYAAHSQHYRIEKHNANKKNQNTINTRARGPCTLSAHIISKVQPLP